MEPRNAEIQNLDEITILAAPNQHDVLGLDIPMNDVSSVGFSDRVANLKQDMENSSKRESANASTESTLQGNPVQILHGDVHGPIGRPSRKVYAHDVGVLKPRGDRGFLFKTRSNLGIPAQFTMKDLDGHMASDPFLVGSIYLAHGSRTDSLVDSEVPSQNLPDVWVSVSAFGGRCFGCP
jgi:hypothetical protein